MIFMLGRFLPSDFFFPEVCRPLAQSLSYQVIRSDRKTLSLEIRPGGELLVRAPKRLSDGEIRKFVLSKRDWIEKHRQKRLPATQPRMTRDQLHSLAQEALAWFPGRVSLYAPKVGVRHGRITIRAQHTRWGSCSAQGNLNFNCLLMLAPESVRDYVIVHELCHRKHMNHSPEFWASVEAVMPDYHVRRQWLKDHGSALLARLPE